MEEDEENVRESYNCKKNDEEKRRLRCWVLGLVRKGSIKRSIVLDTEL